MLKEYNCEKSVCITAVTPTICRLMNINLPSVCNEDAIESLVEEALSKGITRIEKCLIYAPDAIGTYFYKRHTDILSSVIEFAPFEIPLLSIFPPKTPVCFASMFTGVMPEVHGIRQYEKPVIEIETLFDAMIDSGKKTAIAAVADSSIDRIFRNRKIDYFSEIYDEQVTERTLWLINENNHDFIVAYHQEYDDTIHKTTPESTEAVNAAKRHADSFRKLAKCCESAWQEYNYSIMFTPDHGTHIDPDTGKGTHGKNIPEDMEVTHFYGLYSSRAKSGTEK